MLRPFSGPELRNCGSCVKVAAFTGFMEVCAGEGYHIRGRVYGWLCVHDNSYEAPGTSSNS